MQFNEESILKNAGELRAKGYDLPRFDRSAMRSETERNPQWVHFGAGNIFRAFIANLEQNLLNEGLVRTGIIVAEGFDGEILDAAYRPFDNLSVLATLCADGTIRKTVIGSIAESRSMDRGSEDWARLEEIFRSPSLQMASLTITEKGYNILGADGSYTDAVRKDMETGPEEAVSYLGRIAALCFRRFHAGGYPLSLVSMDNCSHNGSRLETAMKAFAEAWDKNGFSSGFLAYVSDPDKVAFPWSMIDKITPRPDGSVQEMIEKDGIEDMGLRVTARHSYVAPYVNSEEAQYLVIEDAFPNGRPPLEKAGVIFTQRETVDMVENMKVCTCLNPLHTSLAVLGCLLGFTKISDEMLDPDLKKLVETVGYKEGLPVVVDPGVIRPSDFIGEVICKRLPNPFLQDTPQRIATDTSQKIVVRFGNTIRKYASSDSLNVRDLKCIAFVIASWCRYLMAKDDSGNAFQPSDDPLFPRLTDHFAKVELGKDCDVHALLQPVLSDPAIMGSDLYEAGLADLVEADFAKLIDAPGAVRRELHRVVES